jgi:hypothetical protein
MIAPSVLIAIERIGRDATVARRATIGYGRTLPISRIGTCGRVSPRRCPDEPLDLNRASRRRHPVTE